MFATAFFCLVELLLISVTLLILYSHSARLPEDKGSSVSKI